MDLMDLRGPDFLKVYAGLFAAAVVLGLCLRRWMRGPGGEPPREALQLDPLEVAYLAGGPRLAINTALASLFRQESLRLTAGTRSLQAVRPPDDSAGAMEQGIYRFIATAPSRSVREVHQNFPTELPARRPEALGLTMPTARRAAVAVVCILPLLVLMLLGVSKLVVGISRNRPVGLLVGFLFVSVVALILFVARTPWRTVLGDGVLAKLRSAHAALRSTAGSRAGALSPAEIALAVGLFGPAVLAGQGEMDDLRRAIAPNNNSASSSCGSGCGSGCGSSGGGGGSGCGGGGGCGGCGGGGGD